MNKKYIVRHGLQPGSYYKGLFVNKDMVNMAGQTLTFKERYNSIGWFSVKENDFIWSEYLTHPIDVEYV